MMTTATNVTSKNGMTGEEPNQDLLTFGELLGAPLTALIAAERQAAIATAKFIKEIGFQEASGDRELSIQGLADESLQELGVNFGNLRMITFLYQSVDSQGIKQKNIIQIPLLSLIPIPMIQLKEANFEFIAEIAEIGHDKAKSLNLEDARATSMPLEPQPVTLMTSLAMESGDPSRHRYQRKKMKVNLTVERSDIPSGLLKLCQLMPQMIRESTVQEA